MKKQQITTKNKNLLRKKIKQRKRSPIYKKRKKIPRKKKEDINKKRPVKQKRRTNKDTSKTTSKTVAKKDDAEEKLMPWPIDDE